MVDGVEVSVMVCFINSCQCQPMHQFLVFEGQSLFTALFEITHDIVSMVCVYNASPSNTTTPLLLPPLFFTNDTIIWSPFEAE